MIMSCQVLMMVRPACFGYNEETAANNHFQHQPAGKGVQEYALEEFDGMVRLLRGHDIPVMVVEDTPEPRTPDSIFPNNWFSTHADGTLVLYPMFAPNRREERRPAVIQAIREAAGTVRVVDLTAWEEKGEFLEGTGSLVLDRKAKTAYACRSPRTSEAVLDDFCRQTGYRPVIFDAVDNDGCPIYHTNVMMSVGEDFAVLCGDAFISPQELSDVHDRLRASGKTVIEVSRDQMCRYACNVLQVRNIRGESFIIMSDTALNCLNARQLASLNEKGSILAAHIPHIEEAGGGSTRCMMAEVFRRKES